MKRGESEHSKEVRMTERILENRLTLPLWYNERVINDKRRKTFLTIWEL